MIRYLLAAAFVCNAVPAFAQTPPAPSAPVAAPTDRPCLQQRNIYDYQLVPGNRSLVVIDLARKRYRLNFIGTCYNLKYHIGIGFRTFGVGGLSCVDKGDSVIIRDVATPGPCIIKDIQYQTPAMDQADAAAAAAAKAKNN